MTNQPLQENTAKFSAPAYIRPLQYCLAIALVLFLIAPLIPNHHFPWQTFHSEFLAILATLFLGIYCLSLKSLKIPTSALVISLISLIPIIQYTTGLIHFFGDAYIACIYLFSFAAAITFGANIYSINKHLFTQLFAGTLLKRVLCLDAGGQCDQVIHP